jgi:hypothetical protein
MVYSQSFYTGLKKNIYRTGERQIMKPIRILYENFLLDDFIRDIRKWVEEEDIEETLHICRISDDDARYNLGWTPIKWNELRDDIIVHKDELWFPFGKEGNVTVTDHMGLEDNRIAIDCADGTKYGFYVEQWSGGYWIRDTTWAGLLFNYDGKTLTITPSTCSSDEGTAIYPEPDFKELEIPLQHFLIKYLNIFK